MPDRPYRDEPLTDHDRSGFRSGVAALDQYFLHQAGQDRRRSLAATYVLVEEATRSILGYYTLSAYGIRPADLGTEGTRFPRYDLLPALLIGRLALHRDHRGKGLGRLLLAGALRRCLALSEELGAVAVFVDAKDEAAAEFYRHAGFISLSDHPNRLFIPMRAVAASLRGRARGV